MKHILKNPGIISSVSPKAERKRERETEGGHCQSLQGHQNEAGWKVCSWAGTGKYAGIDTVTMRRDLSKLVCAYHFARMDAVGLKNEVSAQDPGNIILNSNLPRACPHTRSNSGPLCTAETDCRVARANFDGGWPVSGGKMAETATPWHVKCTAQDFVRVPASAGWGPLKEEPLPEWGLAATAKHVHCTFFFRNRFSYNWSLLEWA